MRICHVSPHLPPDQAANALLPAELGEWARARGHDVAFVAQEPTQGRPASAPLAGPVTRVPARGQRSALARVLKIDTWRRARVIREALDRTAARADLLHLHSNGLIIEVASAWAARRNIPTVLTLYGTEIWHYRRRWIDPFTRAYRAARHVTFYSARLLDKARALGLDRPNVSVVYPAVRHVFMDVDRATRADWRMDLGIAESRVILNVKRLHELAGQKYLLDAFAQVVRSYGDVRLVICGTGPLRQPLEDQARALGLTDKITFAGLVPNEKVARYAGVADVFALPSLLEALPTVAVESLAAGTPVVSADHPGGVELHDIFGDDVRVVPKENVDDLARALTSAIVTPQRTRPATAESIRNYFSPAAVEAKYFGVYEQVFQGGPHAQR